MAQGFTPNSDGKVNWMRSRPFAHRGLHDSEKGIFENTLSAASAAIEHNYSIEVDLQPTLDRTPMVFHDYDLERMTGDPRELRQTPSKALADLKVGNGEDPIPTLASLLDLVNGRVGLVLELKGRVGEDAGFVGAVSEILSSYDGPVAVMSFHHHILEEFREIAPHLPLGLTAFGGEEKYNVNKMIAEKTNVDFVSYELETLDNRFLREFRNTGKPVISWTVRSPKDAEFSAQFADQPTFEGFLP